VSASVAGGKGTASAAAQARRVDLFDGLVKAKLVRAEATASSAGTETAGRIEGLVIDGAERGDFARTRRFRMGDYGRLVVLDRDGAGIVGLRAELTKDRGDHPAGSEIRVAFASARAGDAPPAPHAKPRAARKERKATRRRAKRRRAPELRALKTGRGYTFPVHGEHRFSDDWGAPRQHTGSHEGNDVFAKWGAPVVAVADGRLYRVGTRKVPGNRLWLRSKSGDTFFYAHLSAFAHDARNGARVKAGQVVGFVGSTGDAEQTPPHLHFEIHPRGGHPVDPYAFLRAWEDRRDVPPAAWLSRYGEDPGARPGALVVVRDYLER
jgi:murein DD-endopeptidase MepM/ murein hydrolase activator NlpD